MTSARLKAKLDRVGWREPYHIHFRVVLNHSEYSHDVTKPPVYCQPCPAAECEAEGCPRTESGFPR